MQTGLMSWSFIHRTPAHYRCLARLLLLALLLLAASEAYSIGDWCLPVWLSSVCVSSNFFTSLLLQFLSDSHDTWHTWSAGCLRKSSPPKKLFWNIFTSVKSFCVKFCRFVGNSYPHISTNFCRFILIFHQMALILQWIPIIFTLSGFENSPIKWKCHGRPPTAWFTQNGWASVVNSTADFLNSAQLLPFVRVTRNDWICTKSLLMKRLHTVVVRQFSHW